MWKISGPFALCSTASPVNRRMIASTSLLLDGHLATCPPVTNVLAIASVPMCPEDFFFKNRPLAFLYLARLSCHTRPGCDKAGLSLLPACW